MKFVKKMSKQQFIDVRNPKSPRLYSAKKMIFTYLQTQYKTNLMIWLGIEDLEETCN